MTRPATSRLAPNPAPRGLPFSLPPPSFFFFPFWPRVTWARLLWARRRRERGACGAGKEKRAWPGSPCGRRLGFNRRAGLERRESFPALCVVCSPRAAILSGDARAFRRLPEGCPQKINRPGCRRKAKIVKGKKGVWKTPINEGVLKIIMIKGVLKIKMSSGAGGVGRHGNGAWHQQEENELWNHRWLLFLILVFQDRQ